MARRASDTHTLDLFAVPQPAPNLPASMNYRSEVANLVGEVLKEADGDRYEIASRMSRLAGVEVSKYMLDAWSSEGREAYNMPFYIAPVLESACHTHALTNWLADKRGGQLLVGRETLNAELGKLERLKEDATRKIRDLKKVMEDTA